MFLFGVALFTLASLGCGLAGSTGVLVTLRFVQGAGAAAMIPQVLSLIQRYFPGPARARPMRLYAAVLAGGAVAGQVVGGLLVSADLWGSDLAAGVPAERPGRRGAADRGQPALPRGRGEPGRGLDPAGLAILTPAVLALVLPLVLGQSEHWPAWGWACLAASALGFAAFVLVERRLAAAGGSPLIPGRVLRLPGVAMGIAALFAVLAVFGGFFFTLALHLQGGLGESALRAGPHLRPRRARVRPGQPELAADRRQPAGADLRRFAANAAGLLALAFLLRGGRDGGAWLYLATAVTGPAWPPRSAP